MSSVQNINLYLHEYVCACAYIFTNMHNAADFKAQVLLSRVSL